MLLSALMFLALPKGVVRPVGEVLREVPRRAVATELQDAMVYASDPAVLEARLPRLLLATWRPSGNGGPKLERTPAQRREVGVQDAVAIRATLEAGLEASAGLRSAAFDASIARRLLDGLGRAVIVGDLSFGPRGAADALLAHLVADLAPRLEGESRYQIPDIYADAPTAAERPFASGSAGRVAGYAAVERELARLYAQGGSIRLPEWDYDRIVAPGLTPSGGEDGGVGRMTLRLYRDDRSVSAGLSIYRRDGSKRSEANLDFPIIRAKVTPFRFEGEGDGLGGAEPGGGLSATFLDGEPLDGAVGPALDRLAQRAGLPVVAALPDSAAVAFARTPPKTIGGAVRLLEAEGIEFAIEGAAIVGRAVDAARFGRRNLARPAMRRYLASMRTPGNDWLRSWSRLYAESPQVTPLAMYLRETVLPSVGIPATSIGYDRWTYKLLGLLSDGEWRLLTAGRPLTIGSDPVRREMAAAMAGISQRTAEGKWLPEVALAGSWSFPNGVSPSATLTMTRGGSEIVARTARFKTWTDLPLVAGNSHPEAATVEAMEKEFAAQGKGNGEIEFGTRGARTLTLNPGPGLMDQQEQPELEVRSEGPAVRFGQASAKSRAALLKLVAEIAASRETEGSGAPPP